MTTRLAFLHAFTPLHSGTGQGVGSIDLPIARERATSLPIVPGSSIKGCLRDTVELPDSEKFAVFGPDTKNADAYAGALRVGDARLVLLPVRSLTATFVWTTCPFVLKRLKRDATACGVSTPEIKTVANLYARVTAGTPTIKFQASGKEAPKLVLDEVDLMIEETGGTAKEWADWFSNHLFEGDWRAELDRRFAIVDDDTFTYLAEFCTEVTAHIRISPETGTVEAGALWYQEALPAESVLVATLQADSSRNGVKLTSEQVIQKILLTAPMQLGGKANTGLGVVRVAVVNGAGQ